MERQRNIKAALSAITLLGLFVLLAVGSYSFSRDLTLSAEILVWSYLLFVSCLQVVIAWSSWRGSEVFLEHTDQDIAGKILVFGIIPLVALGFLYLAWGGSYVMVLGLVLLVLQLLETWQDEAQEMKARGLAGAVCLLWLVVLTATGVSGLTLLLLSVLSYQALVSLLVLEARAKSNSLAQ